jgi:hypothetical protein
MLREIYECRRCQQVTVELPFLAESNNAPGDDRAGSEGVFLACKRCPAGLKPRPSIIESASQNPHGLGLKYPVRILPDEIVDSTRPCPAA